MGAAARTTSPSARHAAAAPTAPRGPQRAEAPGRLPASSVKLRHLRAAAIGHPHTDKTVPGPDRDRDRPARSARPAVPDAVAEQLAHQQDRDIPARVPRAEHPAGESAGNPRPLRHPHLAARAATSSSPRPLSASPPAGRSRGTPGPPQSVTSTRTRPSPAVTATVTVPPARPEPLCRTLLPNSSLFTELPDGFPQLRGHAGDFGVRDFYLRAGYVLLPCSRRLRSRVTS